MPSGSIDPLIKTLLLLLLSGEFCQDTRGGRRLLGPGDRIDTSCTVDAERYEFPSMSREYTELAGRGCPSICTTAGTGDPNAMFVTVGVADVVGVCAGPACSSTLASPFPALAFG